MKYLGSTRGAVTTEAAAARSQISRKLAFGPPSIEFSGSGGVERLDACGDLFIGCFPRFLGLSWFEGWAGLVPLQVLVLRIEMEAQAQRK